MFPYFNWAPVLHYPWSGGVTQEIAPNTHWFFDSIAPGGGNSRIEQRVFEEVASYGKQLGLITEVLLDGVDEEALNEKGRQSLARLREIAGRIEKIKGEERDAKYERLRDSLLALRDSDPDAFAMLLGEVSSRPA
jgi:hypothetical protein